MAERLRSWLMETQDVSEGVARALMHVLGAVALVVLAVITARVAKQILLRVVTRLVRGSRTDWDDLFLEHRVFHRLAHLAPALVLYGFSPVAFQGLDPLIALVQRGAQIYLIVVGLLVVDAFLDALHALYQRFEVAQRVPITGFVQVVKIVVTCVGVVLALSVAVQKSPGFFLGGVGAMTAVLMLVFRDPILGFAAGIQLTANRMIRPGDWIEMPRYGADGDVREVTLTTVKVQNWDKTVTTIPTYALISDSFKNWRGMQESGGRRIKRAVYLDMTSVRFCDDRLLEKFGRFRLLADYLARKRREVDEANRAAGGDGGEPVNGRRLTNLGTFRAYLEQYLRHHPKIRQDMTFLVRQLAPTPNGLPLEIYVFSADQAWANYEAIQADIFDHVLAVIPEFELRVFQTPTGSDFKSLVQAVGGVGRAS